MREVRFTLDDESYRQVRLAAAGRLVSVSQWCRAALALSVEDGRVDEATLLGMGVAAGIEDGTPDVLATAEAAVEPLTPPVGDWAAPPHETHSEPFERDESAAHRARTKPDHPPAGGPGVTLSGGAVVTVHIVDEALPDPVTGDVRRVFYGGRWYRLSETSGVPGCQHRTVKRDLGQSVKCRACGSRFVPE